MSWLKKTIIGFTAFLLMLILTVALLIGTTPGLHLVLNSASRWVPGLNIGSASGGWRDLTLKDLHYHMPGVSANVSALHLSLSLSPACLWRGQLCIDALSVQGLDVVVKTQQMPVSEAQAAPTAPSTEITIPFTLDLQHFSLSNSLVTVDDMTLSLAEFRSGLHWQGRKLTLLPTYIGSLLVALPKTPSPNPETPPSVVNSKLSSPGLSALSEQPLGERLQSLFAKPLLSKIPDITLPMDVTVTEIQGKQLRITGSQDLMITRFFLQASNQRQKLTLHRLDLQSPQGALFAHGEATLGGQWPLVINANGVLNIDPLKGERLKLTVNGALHEQLNVALNLSGPQRAQLALQTKPAVAGLPLSLSLQSPQVRWPITGDARYQLNDIHLNINGKATDYALSLHSALQGSELPPGSLLLEGKGNVRQFSLTRLRLDALQGNVEMTGQMDWNNAISWNSELTLSGINTEQQWPQWPARLNGKLVTQGSIEGRDWQLKIPQLQLEGNVRQNRLTAQGKLSGNAAGQWSISDLALTLGRNRLMVKGTLGEQWNITGDINAPALDGTLPGLAGRIVGNLKLDGNRDAPHLKTDLAVSELRWQNMTIKQLDIAVDVQSDKQIHGAITVHLQQLHRDSLRMNTLALRVEGNETEHQVHLTMNGEPVSGQLSLAGSFDRAQQRWRGEITSTHFDTPVGEWRLMQAMSLDYQVAQQKMTIGHHCWHNPDAELCVPRPIEVGPSGQASLVLKRFDLVMLKPLMGNGTELGGNVTGNADVSWQTGAGLPQAKITLTGHGVTVQQQVQGKTLPIAVETLTLNAGITHDQAQLAWEVALRGNGRFAGDVQIADPQNRRDLSGNVSISHFSLDMLNPVLREGEKAAGLLNASLRLGGNVQRPELFGQMVLEQLDIDGNWMPVDLTNGRLAVYFNGVNSTLQGFLKTTNGQVNLAGNADWSQVNDWRAHIAVKGERVRITLPPMVRLDISPDITFDASSRILALNGMVTIPWARIVVHDMPPSAVDVSKDEVMLNEKHQPITKASSGILINSNLIVRIGDDVWLDAYGLHAQLKGDLKVAQNERGLGLNGHINIPSGRFKAYGQDLQIRKGQLLFSGPPAQPMLDIEAIRNPDNTEDDVTVGVRITGLATSPRLTIFSEPTLSQQEALSYLLRGQGLGSSGTDSAMMTSALIGLGVAQSGQVVGKIGEAFGVSNLALDTQGAGDSSQVVVSGYVLPGLQVKYGVGIFDSLATLTLRYRLMPKLYLEAVSGINQALDVLYQFEF